MSEAIRTQSLVDALRDAIQKSILEGSYAPGTQLTEQGVAHHYSVARPTAKAAMEQLVRVGILRRTRHRTTHVPILDRADIRDLYFSRSIVERAVVTALAREGHAVGPASRSIERLRASTQVSDIVNADIEFHRALVVGLERPRVMRLHEAIIGEAHLCMAQVQTLLLLRPIEIADEHEAILDAIAARDSDAAGLLMDQHLRRACDRLIEHWGRQEPASSATSQLNAGLDQAN